MSATATASASSSVSTVSASLNLVPPVGKEMVLPPPISRGHDPEKSNQDNE